MEDSAQVRPVGRHYLGLTAMLLATGIGGGLWVGLDWNKPMAPSSFTDGERTMGGNVSTLELLRVYNSSPGADDVVIDLIEERGQPAIDEVIAILHSDPEEDEVAYAAMSLLSIMFPSKSNLKALKDYANQLPSGDRRRSIESSIEDAKEAIKDAGL